MYFTAVFFFYFVQAMIILSIFVSIYEKCSGPKAVAGILRPSVILFILYAVLLVFFKFVAPQYWKIEMYIERYSFLIRSFMIRSLNLDSSLLFLKNLFSVENAAVLLLFIISFTVIFVKNKDIRKTCSIMKSPLAVFFFFSIIDLWNNSGAGSVKADGFWNVWLTRGNGINFLFYFIPYFIVTVLSLLRFSKAEKFSGLNIPDSSADEYSSYEDCIPGTFNRYTAWEKGAAIPPFSLCNAFTGKPEIFTGYYFAGFLQNQRDPLSNKVLIEKLSEDGNSKQIEITETSYKKIIDAEEKFQRDLSSAEEGSWKWYMAYEERDKALGLDSGKLRSGTAENFIHNYKVCCKYASDFNQATDMAKKLFDLLPKNQKKMFKKSIKQYGSRDYKTLLKQWYDEARSEL